MRTLFCSLVLLASTCALAQKPAVVTTPVAPPPQTGPTAAENENSAKARQVLDRMIRALGGDAYMSYTTMTETGRSYRFWHGEPAGTGVVFWRFWEYPDKDRMELTKQRDWIIIYKGDGAWEKTFRGTAKLDPDDLKEYLETRSYSNEYVLRQWLKAPGTSLFYDGATIAEQRPAEKVTIMDAQNRAVSYFIDSNTHLPIKKSYTVRDPQTKDRDDVEEVYDNYRLIQGIQTPLSWTWNRNGQMHRQRFLNTVSYNAPFAATLFQPDAVNYNPKKK
jgi:hypothetical protein